MSESLDLEICKDLEFISNKKRKGNLILFFGRDSFSDNSKYLFLHMLERYRDMHVVWCTNDERMFDELNHHQLPCYHFGRDLNLTYRLFLEAAVAVFCINPMLSLCGNIPMLSCLAGACKIQLWHGVGVKRIDLATTSIQDFTQVATTKVLRAVTESDYYLSPSAFADEKWNEFFGAKTLIRAGYPRNELLLREPNELELIGADLGVRTHQGLYESPAKKLLLAPTWSDSSLDVEEMIMRIVQFGYEYDVNVFVKAHPNIDNSSSFRDDIKNLFFVPPMTDIYPHLRHFDAVATDFSSIIFDYLLTDKPVLTVDVQSGQRFDYALIPNSDEFRYQFNADNIEQVFEKALFHDDKHEARQQMKAFVFSGECQQANQVIAEKIMGLYQQHQAARAHVTVI